MKKLMMTSLFAASVAISQGAGIHAGLLNYWALDGDAADTASSFAEGTGTTANDGSVNGSVTFGATGPFGSAANFPGGAGNNVTVADPSAGTDDIDRTAADLTISLWFQLSNRDTNWQGLIGHGEGADYRIALRGGNDPIQLAYAGGGAGSDIFSASNIGAAPGGDGLWHHLVATTQGSSTALYLDGVLEATGGTGPIGASGANLNLLCIGCNPDNGREWNGLIDDIGMWDRSLSLGEVQQIYTAGLQGTALGAIPEPSTGLLGALAGLLVIARRRR